MQVTHFLITMECSLALKIGIMIKIFGKKEIVLWSTKVPGGTTAVMIPNWMVSTYVILALLMKMD